ncbi:Z1 domain-containing protein [Sphingomonas fuzhouensis]|uniref:Z1 domain-containing protein n=1 Tax=Sphingomonas fuzhouensis TaxID=3106033 RepID=UPI002AFE76D6|nr:Z1 domain-containing protein [Sphingomonas sp. SGZ-02]
MNELHGAALAQGEALPEGAIRHLVETGPFSHLDEAARTAVVRELEGAFVTRQRRGSIIVSNARPWLIERRPYIDFYYWNRLRRFYMETGILPAHVLATLDHDTDQVLDQCGDPSESPAGARRGMVMGHVQSGKTTNYSALICKAADAGYKVIILLAGITNSLRAQTQERLDETFIGKKSVFGPIASELMPIQNFAGTRRVPSYGTTRDADFVSGRDGMFFSLSGHSEPIIFVTKKNKGVLERLRDWLGEQDDAATFPLILIDDEADNASINTAKDPRRTTAINGVIRDILGRFPRSAYVGYTATPFANIFIDPDTPADMEHDDLFPRHFIKALDPPTNYVGSRRVFWEQGDLRQSMVRVIDDYRGVLPLAHKAHELPSALPASLLKAIRVFCLTRAIRILRGQGCKHCSMMVNVSRFNAVQDAVHGLLYGYLTQVREAITVHAGLAGGGDDPVMRDLRDTFGEEFGGLDVDWDDMLPVLLEAVSSIQTRVVNMRGGVLDYSAHREHGLHVIAVGGLALSRGLTLEGLTVSYILRNTAASDTLMQMARWFGYRPGYEEICRLYLPRVSLDHYEDVDDATEELRLEVKRMERLRMTPADFGLKVRQSQLAIRVTAANKMRTATAMTIAQDYGARHVEGHALINSAEVNARNERAAAALISTLGPPEEVTGGLLWRGVPAGPVMDMLRAYECSPVQTDLSRISDTSLLVDYLSDRVRDELAVWDVAIPQLRNGPATEVAGISVRLRQRGAGQVRDGTYRVNGQKSRVADKPDVTLGMSDEEKAFVPGIVATGEMGVERANCAARSKPLLLLHMFNASLPTPGPGEESDSDAGLEIGSPVVTLSVALPGSSRPARTRVYQVNAVYRRQLDLFAAEEEDEEDDDGELINGDDDAQ